MKSLIHRVLVSVLTIALVYAFLPAQKVLADPLSINKDFLSLQVYQPTLVTTGGETKSYGVAVNNPEVAYAYANRIQDTIFVVGLAEGQAVITVYDYDTGERCYLYVSVIASKVLEAPVLTVTTEGNTVTLSWSQVRGADGYIIDYASFSTKTGRITGLYSAELGDINTLSGELPSGSAYYVVIQAYGTGGFSNFSNVGCFIIE